MRRLPIILNERVRQFHVLVDRGLHFIAGHVFFKPRHVEADILGDGKCAHLVGLTTTAKKLLVKFQVFFSGRILHARGDCDTRCFDRAWT